MKEEMDGAQAELNALKRTEEDLKKGHQKLEEMVTRLDQEVVSNAWKTYVWGPNYRPGKGSCAYTGCVK